MATYYNMLPCHMGYGKMPHSVPSKPIVYLWYSCPHISLHTFNDTIQFSCFNNRHTCAVWTVQGNSDDEDFSGYMIAGPGECYIAEISNLDGQANEADAALIAAAPELLEALQEFIECGPNAGHNQDLIVMAQAAIAKAINSNKN